MGRSAPDYSLEEELSIWIYSFPINSYDDLHLPTLWEEKFSIRVSPFPLNSYDDLYLPTL